MSEFNSDARIGISTSASTTNVAITAGSIATAAAAMELAISEANDKHPLAQYMVKHGVNHRTHYMFLNSDDAAGLDMPDFARASPNCPKGEVMFLLRAIVDSLKWPPR